ncbi:hypothetical protein PUNSTDRAFT_95826 [Punctularia strigosozonata HHB-11173 SS5]|uniref:uncharacterized protein n=1 Tax=Punctularia strigosozonata (strain HHB-11173) TaxID=741275 RepID=UPI00044184E2|nr:uncharacterized protein PUNSTDRAFT_95826 [Punctularia strigosozonata HHB-11173 SS5]EIN14180.1 hypothetical protein PUNSTDRAFT_95826 [Punctularia strigosozonata HHB-11173 SS5]
MGLVVCNDAKELEDKFEATKGRAKSLFKNDGLFLERYISSARHIEVQVFGDGHGHAIHMGERECSVQRRHQKVLEESPSSFMDKHPDVRQKMYDAAVKLCQLIKYGSAGTVEFIVDDSTAEFFFLEMNTRLQVEHPVTEAVHPGLDLVELMIKQGIAERAGVHLAPDLMDQSHYGSNTAQLHAIEARVNCENPATNFKPSPGVLQLVEFPKGDWPRLENWVGTGTTVTPFYDPLACKLIVTGTSRSEAVSRLKQALSETKILGPPNNISYLDAICSSKTFQDGNAMTTFPEHFKFTPGAMDVIPGEVETTVQDLPGHLTGLGMPRSGPMDPMAFMAANALVSNDVNTEALEVTLAGCKLYFHVPAVVAVCGPPVSLTINREPEKIWTKVVVPAGGRLVVGTLKEKGMRVYVGVRGGFPGIPKYLESKSTSMGLGGYQGRSLTVGDHIEHEGTTEHPNAILERVEDPARWTTLFSPTHICSWNVERRTFAMRTMPHVAIATPHGAGVGRRLAHDTPHMRMH